MDNKNKEQQGNNHGKPTVINESYIEHSETRSNYQNERATERVKNSVPGENSPKQR